MNRNTLPTACPGSHRHTLQGRGHGHWWPLGLDRRDESGGESGIRTRVTVSRKHTFQACAFNHSATSPHRFAPAGYAGQVGEANPVRGIPVLCGRNVAAFNHRPRSLRLPPRQGRGGSGVDLVDHRAIAKASGRVSLPTQRLRACPTRDDAAAPSLTSPGQAASVPRGRGEDMAQSNELQPRAGWSRRLGSRHAAAALGRRQHPARRLGASSRHGRSPMTTTSPTARSTSSMAA